MGCWHYSTSGDPPHNLIDIEAAPSREFDPRQELEECPAPWPENMGSSSWRHVSKSTVVTKHPSARVRGDMPVRVSKISY
jgi:hypothetical protein